MIPPVIPENDAERVIALRTYDILDTPEEEIFDQLTSEASEVCNTPISLLTLVDGDRQWSGLTTAFPDAKPIVVSPSALMLSSTKVSSPSRIPTPTESPKVIR